MDTFSPLLIVGTLLMTVISCIPINELSTIPVSPQTEPCSYELDDDSETTTTLTDSFIECGPGKCSADEVCVTWEKHCENSQCDAEIHLEYHECFPKGEHWTMVNPTGGKLCADNETHQIMEEIKQPCLKDPVPCNLHWWYKCVPETESPHSCANKKCSEDLTCYETIECDLLPPCILKAKCDLCLYCQENIKSTDTDEMKSVDTYLVNKTII